MRTPSLIAAAALLSLSLFAQTEPQSNIPVEPMEHTPTFRVNVVSRTVPAVNYQHRSGATKIDFEGTSLMPEGKGQAKVESKKGYTEIEVEFGNLDKPTKFGNEYLTYVLWALTPEGRAVNLGEVVVGSNHRSKLDVSTDMQAFAMIVTAEPYFAVREPSDVVVLQNIVRNDTKGAVEPLTAKHDFLQRGGYVPTGYRFDPVILTADLPLEYFEAVNAMRIAKSEGADKYASDSYQRAEELMQKVQDYSANKKTNWKPIISVSRDAVQTAEDARAISVQRIAEERRENERRANQEARERSEKAAEEARSQREQADRAAEQAKLDRERSQREAEEARLQREKAEADAAKAQAEAAQRQAESQQQLASAQAQAEQNRLAAEQAQQQAQQAQQQAQQAEREKQEMRERLTQQLNSVLQTRDTARGLIVNMSDVLFDTGKYTLKPGTREKLAKVAGILLAYPGLNVEVDGHTDNVGSDQLNQRLSENRAKTVRDYLVKQGVPDAAVTSKGFGKTEPVASNANAAGRQQNRRVELVVSGEAIGKETTTGEVR